MWGPEPKQVEVTEWDSNTSLQADDVIDPDQELWFRMVLDISGPKLEGGQFSVLVLTSAELKKRGNVHLRNVVVVNQMTKLEELVESLIAEIEKWGSERDVLMGPELRMMFDWEYEDPPLMGNIVELKINLST